MTFSRGKGGLWADFRRPCDLEAAHAAVAIQKFHSPSPEQGPNKRANFCCGRFLLSMILSYVHVLLSTQIAAIRDTRIQGKSRAIYFRTLRAASRIEGATHKYTLYKVNIVEALDSKKYCRACASDSKTLASKQAGGGGPAPALKGSGRQRGSPRSSVCDKQRCSLRNPLSEGLHHHPPEK